MGNEIQQAQSAELPGDLQVEGRLGHVGGLDDPVEAVLVVADVALLDELERRLFAQRLQLDDRGFKHP